MTLQWSRGRSPSEIGSPCCQPVRTAGFNGAEGDHPRRWVRESHLGAVRQLLQWSRGRSPSEIIRPIPGRSSGGSSFNGAEGDHPRRCNLTAPPCPRPDASMEPRAITLGDLYCKDLAGAVSVSGFNGAEGDHPRRSRDRRSVGERLLIASMEPRAITLGDPQRSGRDIAGRAASMEPRAITLGDSRARAERNRSRRRFNGAEGDHPRRCFEARSSVMILTTRFNGAEGDHPRRFKSSFHSLTGSLSLQWSRGRSPSEIYLDFLGRHLQGRMLQWSRGRSPSEIGAIDCTIARKISASMEPRAITLGDVASDDAPHNDPRRRRASMEPRAITLGDDRTDPPTPQERTLQWSRGRSPSEIYNGDRQYWKDIKLQWSRGRSPSEIQHSPVRRLAARTASMEPRAITLGDLPPQRGGGGVVRASMEPRAITLGDASP